MGVLDRDQASDAQKSQEVDQAAAIRPERHPNEVSGRRVDDHQWGKQEAGRKSKSIFGVVHQTCGTYICDN